MFERLDSRSSTPLYAQIASQVKAAIAAGDLSAGDGLPSVRQLAAQLRVNPATIVQAYRDLETEGFVEMRQGAGTFVNAVGTDLRARERSSQAKRLVRGLMSDAARLGLTPKDILAVLKDEIRDNGA